MRRNKLIHIVRDSHNDVKENDHGRHPVCSCIHRVQQRVDGQVFVSDVTVSEPDAPVDKGHTLTEPVCTDPLTYLPKMSHA